MTSNKCWAFFIDLPTIIPECVILLWSPLTVVFQMRHYIWICNWRICCIHLSWSSDESPLRQWCISFMTFDSMWTEWTNFFSIMCVNCGFCFLKVYLKRSDSLSSSGNFQVKYRLPQLFPELYVYNITFFCKHRSFRISTICQYLLLVEPINLTEWDTTHNMKHAYPQHTL